MLYSWHIAHLCMNGLRTFRLALFSLFGCRFFILCFTFSSPRRTLSVFFSWISLLYIYFLFFLALLIYYCDIKTNGWKNNKLIAIGLRKKMPTHTKFAFALKSLLFFYFWETIFFFVGVHNIKVITSNLNLLFIQ